MNQQILRAPASELIPNPDVQYVDVHGTFESCMDYVMPHPEIPTQNLLFNSDHGLGKSLLVAQMTVELGKRLGYGVPMVVYDCSEDTREWDLLGMPTVLGDGSTAFQLGPFPTAIDLANEVGTAVLVLEELSALPPGSQKACNRMTDWRKGIYLAPVGKMYALQPGKNLIIMATMNPSAYAGVYSINQDLRSRFGEEKLPQPSRSQMERILQEVCPWADVELIKKTTQLVEETRTDALEYSLSTRDIVQLLQKVHRKNGKVEDPLRQVVYKFEDSEAATVADRVDAIFATRLKRSVGRSSSHV
jgi:MoxR-like ATPase